MKKIILAGVIASMSSATFAADLSQACTDYYAAVDKYVEQIASHDAMKGQVDMIKAQYDDSKKMIESMPKDSQDAACNAANDAMKQAEEMMKSMGH
ncbi:DUF5339 family protein [Paenalcaligenes sp. Me131]|uniref:DUF5339 family protein n=1 Tax=Paenalcaligenes sp. Me131 TaxID=3392636 RepID=UPI003D294A1C